MSGKVSPMTEPKPTNDDQRIWMSCRATPDCTGLYAVLVWRRPVKDGMLALGESFRYRCLTCHQPFHIRR